MKWLDEWSGPVWRYRSELRPITQLPLNRLDFIIDPAAVGNAENRDLLMQHELSAAEVKQLDLTLVQAGS